MTSHPFSSRLRLVRPPASALLLQDDTPPVEPRRAQDVRRENCQAATLTTDQTRDLFARRVAESLEGGTSAILRPERRQRLADLATRIGLRPFDAQLVIALTQDAARRGEIAIEQLPQDDHDQRRTEVRAQTPAPLIMMSIAMILGLAFAMIAIAWMRAG